MTKENYRAYNSVSDGIIDMFGIVSSFDGAVDGILVDEVINDSPAAKGGIQKGDIITKVGGITVTKNNYYVLLYSLMGKEGSEANLGILRKTDKSEQTIKLSMTKFTTVSSYFFKEIGIGVISINYFSDKTYDDFEGNLKGLIAEGPAGIIIDVRGNAGGDLSVMAKVLDRLVPSGTMFTEKYSGKDETDISAAESSSKTYTSDENSIDVPLVFLADDYTKGVAEIFTASAKSLNYTVVGTKTFGKVFLQDVINLGDETAIMFSAKKYANAKGEDITDGVDPTDSVALADELKVKLPNLDSNEDTQLQKALTYFNTSSSSTVTSSAD